MATKYPEEQELRREAAEEQADETKARMDAEHTGVEDSEDVKSVEDDNEINVELAETNGNNNSTSNIEPAYTKEPETIKSTKTQHKTTTSEHTNTQASAQNKNIETHT